MEEKFISGLRGKRRLVIEINHHLPQYEVGKKEKKKSETSVLICYLESTKKGNEVLLRNKYQD